MKVIICKLLKLKKHAKFLSILSNILCGYWKRKIQQVLMLGVTSIDSIC